MQKTASNNPWAKSDDIIKKIKSRIDQTAIDSIAQDMHEGLKDGKKRLKGIYFDADIAYFLDKLKSKRVNVSGFVNEAVREWVEKNGG
jgi:hypothetical protein